MSNIAYLWMLIPIIAIASGMFKDYLKFKASQKELGASNTRLSQQVVDLEGAKERLERRVETLEAVVTSRLWHSTDPSASPADKARLDIALSQIEPEAPSAERRMERLAEGLRV